MSDVPIIHRPLRRHSKKLTQATAEIAIRLLSEGYTQHEAAAYLEVNQGRISELKNGKIKFSPDSPPLPGLF
jgi:predicted XRE-type DNA-binding protein